MNRRLLGGVALLVLVVLLGSPARGEVPVLPEVILPPPRAPKSEPPPAARPPGTPPAPVAPREKSDGKEGAPVETIEGEEGDDPRHIFPSEQPKDDNIMRLPLYLKADSIIVDEVSFYAEGHVEAAYRDLVIHSEVLEGEKGSQVVKARGNVVLEQAGEKTYGDELLYNARDRTGYLTRADGKTRNIYAGTRPIQGDLFYRGERIQWEPDFFEVLHASITTCDFPEGKKHYRITGRKVEVYPGDVMIIYQATLWLGTTRLWTIPRYVINLKPERKRKQPHPEMGYNKTDGFFVKTRTPYYFERGNFGDLVVNWASKQGFTEGVDHWYALGGRGEGSVHLLKQNSKAAGVVRERFATINNYRFGDGITASWAFNISQDRVPPNIAPTILASNLTLNKQSKFYRASVGFNFSTFGFENQSFGVNYQHAVMFRNDFRGDFSANYFANRSPGTLATSLITKTGLIHTSEDLTTELIYEKSDTNPRAIFVERAPEVLVRTPLREFAPWSNWKLPYQIQLAVGRFFETKTLNTVNRADLLLTLPQKTWELTRNFWLDTSFQYKQDVFVTTHIPTRNLHARYILSANALLRELLFRHVEIQTGFRSQIPNGFNPLEFDNLNRFRLLTGELSIFNRDHWRFNVGTAYDLENNFYQNLVARADWRPKKGWRVHLDGSYDVNRNTWQNLVAYSDLLLRKDLRFQQWISYDFGQREITYQDYALLKDYHDWTLSLVYRGSRQEFFIHATLKAFPDEGVGIGISPTGPVLDPSLLQFYR